MNGALRTVGIPLATAFALMVPAVQSLTGFGLSASEFAQDGDGTLRAAGYAFSIWSVIYAGLAAYAIWQALPSNRSDLQLDRIAPGAFVAILGCGLWILAASFDMKWASVGVILLSAIALTINLLRAVPLAGRPKSRIFALWPLGLLAGWLTIASAINVLTVLTAYGMLGGAGQAAAALAMVALLVIALVVIRVGDLPVYGVPIVWGLIAVWVAERGEKTGVAMLAISAALALGCFVLWSRARKADLRPSS